MNTEIENLLYYYQEDGNEGYDLSEVQLLEIKVPARIEKLKDLLLHDNRYIGYQAMLILLAWAIPEGFEFLNRFVNEKWDQKEEFEPHRIYGEDNVYDVIADALYISTFNGKNEEELYPYIQQLLHLYGSHFFESDLKNLLLKKDFSSLIQEIKQAMQEALQHHKYYQASQLFPVLVHYDKSNFNEYKEMFTSLINLDNRIAYNIEESEKIKRLTK